MKKLASIAFVYLLTINLCSGQTQHKTIGTKRAILAENVTPVATTSSPAENSSYFGYDNQIKQICVNDAIPAALPTKEGYSSKQAYKTAINKWLKDNSSFVKPENINKVIND